MVQLSSVATLVYFQRMATGNIEVKVSSLEIVDPNEPVEGIIKKAETQNASITSGVPPGKCNFPGVNKFYNFER